MVCCFIEQLIEKLKSIKARTRMYFLLEGPEELYSFLQGYDFANGTEYCGLLFRAISKKKRNGNVILTKDRLSLAEAIDIAIEALNEESSKDSI